MKFTIVTVALNPGEKLRLTLDSVFSQTYMDYEIILKDGGSTDGSMEEWKTSDNEKVCFFEEKDKGIYDAMNQAVNHATGEYVIFLNCGDVFADSEVLERVAACIHKTQEEDESLNAVGVKVSENEEKQRKNRYVFYGDTYSEKTKVTIASAPEITGFTCYRNIPCHQSCFYSSVLCREKAYDLQYKIRADYDHFLWCYYRGGAKFVHMDLAVSSYEGGGYSESTANIQRDAIEHKQITAFYMEKTELWKYKLFMALTFAPLRKKMAESRLFSGGYHKLKQILYRH